MHVRVGLRRDLGEKGAIGTDDEGGSLARKWSEAVCAELPLNLPVQVAQQRVVEGVLEFEFFLQIHRI